MIKINSQSFSLPSTVIPVVAQKNNKDNNIITQQQQYHHGMTSRQQNGYISPSYELSLRRNYSKEKMWQLHYVTERILSAVFPLNNKGTNDEDDLMEMFNQKYGKNYRIFDLESCFSKISLEKLCELCKQINLWLEISDKHIVVLQDRGSNQRLGAAVETYLEYTKICASTENRYLNSAVDVKDLDIYSMQKFLNDVTGPIIQPPFKRYIECFTALLSGQLKLNSTPITISHVIMQFPPLLHQVYPYESEWKTFMQVYENEQCVFVSDIYVMPMKTKEIFYEIKSPLTLFGEIAINFYKIDQKPSNKNILLSSLMFHSCSVTGDQIEFPKNDLLMAYNDNRFPKEHKVILLIDNALRSIRRKSESPARHQIGILRNYQNEFNHTQGPVNGSLYATVTRGQTSPQTTEKVLERVEVSRVTNSRLSDHNDAPRRNRNISSSEQDELDSLLSEMMLTVQNMPDVSKKNVRKENISPVNFNNYDQNEKYLFKNIESSKHNHTQPTQQHTLSDDLMLFGYSKNKDQFENVSVSTVESSRNSPLMYDLQNRQKQYNNSNMFYYNSDSDTDTQSRSTKAVNSKRFNYQYEDDEHNIRENYIILQNSDQSYSHMQSNNNAKQNFDIPYHARKDSQPFTYGNINSGDTNMIRTTHSGLSSPSMVRRAASIRSDSSASTLTNRKIPTHEFDFEDMLHEHQEKKYSFGDKTPNREFKSIYNNNNNNNKFEYGIKTNNNNNYRIKTTTTTSYEKNNRQDDLSSNSMDNNHSFDRSGYSSDGSYNNGATWLQIQQQKLRSKKASQQNDFTDGEIIRRSRTLSPNGNFQTITTKTVTTSAKQPTTIRTKQVEYQYKPVRRDESYQVSRIDSDLSRPPTPAFPPPTPTRGYTNSPSLPPKSPTLQRREFHVLNRQADAFGTIDKWSSLQRSTSSASNHSEPQAQEVDPNFVKFARDSSKYWYKPTLSRENAVRLLRNAPPGTFLVRDSTSFNAFGLVVKVPNYPPGSNNRANSDELVRHFLIEPTVRGVRLKGCANEPVFSSLSALIYQHSITPLSLPCRLIIPDRDLENNETLSPLHKQLLEQGAACNVLYLYSAETESLTGPAAIRRTVAMLHEKRRLPKPIQVHFKVSQQGITLTDNTRQLFFRKHYPSNTITYIGLDPDESRWSVQTQGEIPVINYRIFAFIAKKSPTSVDNQCHLFCELEDHQPATAIVSFGNKVLTGASKQVALNVSSQI